ncbi:MAG: alpha/beta hydrolase [Bacteroidetes bacterium]|nr:alpha/beta hydrolase [Bacteroidota bacterium]
MGFPNTRFTAKFHIVILLFLFASKAQAQSDKWIGQWVGNLQADQLRLAVMFKLEVKYGGWYSKINIPQQGVKNQTVSKTSIDKKTIRFELESFDAFYEGRKTDSNTIKGYFHQAGKSYQLTLKRVWGDWPKPKPQTPKKPYSFVDVPIRIPVANGRIMVGATLSKPDSIGKFPVVVLISGSGPQDRNGTIGEHEPFLIFTDFFTKRGFAIFRYDDRGIGETKGHPEVLKNTTSADIAMDVGLFVDYLKNREDIDTNLIGLLGHSEGGIVAPMLAANRNDISFIICLAGPAAGGMEASIYQNEKLLRDNKVNKRNTRSFIKIHKQLISIGLHTNDTALAHLQMDSAVRKWKRGAPFKAKYILFAGKKMNLNYVHKTYDFVQIPWWKFFLGYDPVSDIQKLHCPVLALNGSRDDQVACHPNLDVFEQHIPNKNLSKVECLPGLNHLFQKCDKCTFSEYFSLSESLNSALLNTMDSWMRSNNYIR